MIKLEELLEKFYIENIINSDLLESKSLEMNEITLDISNAYNYQNPITSPIPVPSESWEFYDRCGNHIIVVYIQSIGEVKSGFKVNGIPNLIFDPSTLSNGHELIRPCPDDKKVNTIFKILSQEIIPKYLLNKKPNKLVFNPVSASRKKLVDIILSKTIHVYPQLLKNNNYLIYK